MTTFCLIHSSGQGPEGWRLVREELEARGHRVLTPAFDVDEPDKGAAWHAENLVGTLRGTPNAASEMVCVAHSAGGIFLPLIAQQCEARRMVFLAALIPRPGISILDQFRADRSMFHEEWIGRDPMIDEVALRFLYHDCSPERAQWALATRVSFYAKRAMEEPCPLAAWPAIAADYIVCTDDRTISPAWQRKAARECLGVTPLELPGGHCPNVSRPEALAGLLEDCLAGSPLAGAVAAR
jgi:pimeloyl-ACP methyl ester carboxylesterase